MTSEIIKQIKVKQSGINAPADTLPPVHQPEMLLIGCVDARLNISDIGIPYGKALVYRNIAALVSGTKGDDDPEHIGEAATLEFAVNVMQVKEIVVMGHTDCGGIRACLHGLEGTRHIMQYLSPLEGVRRDVTMSSVDSNKLAHQLEKAAVKQSIENLMTYDAVSNAVKVGRLALHGWVINTATRRIIELDLKSGEFREMAG